MFGVGVRVMCPLLGQPFRRQFFFQKQTKQADQFNKNPPNEIFLCNLVINCWHGPIGLYRDVWIAAIA